MTERVRPPRAGDERAVLVGWLDLQRALVPWKVSELSDEDAHRAVRPASPLMTAAGVVAHLRWTEHCWFNVLFLGEAAAGNPQFDEHTEDLDMMVENVPLAELVAAYEAQCAESNRIVGEHALDGLGKHPQFRAGETSLRWMLVHMIEETARHVGHLDAIRELLDGRTGYY